MRRGALGWSTLEKRRRRGNLIQLHRIHHDHIQVIFINGDRKLASDGEDKSRQGTQELVIDRARYN